MTASEIGICYGDLLNLDIRKFNCMVDGYIKRRETRLNDDILLIPVYAAKIGQYVWGDKQFKKPIKEIKLLEDSSGVASKNAKVFKTLKAKGLI